MPQSISAQWSKYNSQFKYHRKEDLYSKDMYYKMHENLTEMYAAFPDNNRGIVTTGSESSDLQLFEAIKDLLYTFTAVKTIDCMY